MKKYLLSALAVMIVFFVGTIFYITQVYRHTPEYTVTILRDAYAQRNVALFTAHVDIASVTKHFVLRDLQEDKNVVKPVPEEVLNTLFAEAVSSTEGAVHSAILGDREVVRKGEKNPLVDKLQALLDYRLVLSITAITTKKIDDEHSLLYVTFVNRESKEETKAVLALERLADKTWIIKDIPNANDITF